MNGNFTKNLLSFIFILSLGFFINSSVVSAQNCDVPIGLNTSGISNFSATLNWDLDTNVDHYRLRYKENGSSSWLYEHNATGVSFDVVSLNQLSTYIWQAKAFCSSGSVPTSTWSVVDTFITTNYPVDCNNTQNGAAFTDSCGNCVGGTTGDVECIEFTPSVSFALSTIECNVLSDITFITSQDANEPDISSSIFSSDNGFFNFTGLMSNDVIGSADFIAGGGYINVNTTLMVDFIINLDKISVKAVDNATNQIYGSFTIENASGGILVVATSLPDNNNVTSGNSQTILLNGLFTNPDASVLNFTSIINSELGDVDNQTSIETIECFDCDGILGGTSFIDSCGNCVGGSTGNVACIPFTPTVSVSLSNTDCDSLTDLTINVSQDPNEPDMLSALYTSNVGSFDISNMNVGDVIGSAVMSANGGTNTFNTNLIVTTIVSNNQVIIQSQDVNTGLVLGSFTILNLNPGISISATTVPDGNNFTSGNSSTIIFSNVFINPAQSTLVFTTTLDSELGDQAVQSFPFTITCLVTDFSPTILISLSNTDCDSLSDLTISVSQDAGEVDMLSALYTSNVGSFDISNMNVGDVIGSAVMSANGGTNTFNTNLIVTTIVSNNQVIIQSQDVNTGLVLGSFTILNLNPGISISATTVPDGNNFTSGNSSTIIFSNVFINPAQSTLVFTTTLDSELGDQAVQSFPFTITCLVTDFSPTILISLSNTDCDSLSDLTISVSQDAGEVDMLSALYTSNVGSFDISNMNVGDVIGSAVMSANGGTNTFNTNLIVTTIVSNNQVIIQSQDVNTGLVLGSFTILNLNPGISISATTVPDGNNFTSGNSSTIIFSNVFINPAQSTLVFTTTLDSELGDQAVQSFPFTITCLVTDFSPTILISLSNTDCDSLSDLTISVSQDAGEVDMLSALYTSNVGSFDISNMNVGDVIGSAVMSANGGTNTFNTNLIVTTIVSNNQVIIQSQDVNTGLVLGSFTILNLNPGISISATTVPDGNNFTSGNSSTIIFSNVFINPAQSTLVFTTTLDSELGDQAVQSFPFTITCLVTDFSPTILISLSNTDCDSLSDLTISVSQDAGEVDMLSALYTSNVGSFDISNMNVGDVIGSAVMSANGGTNTFNTNLIVTTIVSNNQVIIQSQDVNTGLVLGSFTILNLNPGISISATTVPDGNNFTSGNSSTIIFSNVFINPAQSTLVFTTTLDSELGDQAVQSFPFTITCLVTDFSPTILISLSNTDCDSLSDLTISVSQDAGEVDMLSALYTSNVGSFDISNMNVGDVIGSAVMSANGGTNTFNTNLIVTTIVSNNQVIIQSQDVNTGLVLGSFTILNLNPGISISATTVPDGNNFTSGNSSTIIFSNVFINPAQSTLVFTTTLDSELGDQAVQSFPFTITCIIPGCTDPLAFNYDATANTDDGSCIAIALGCTDPLAFNYDATANTDDGSCIAIALGCTDPLAFNYDATANTDDGSCIAIALGCTDPLAFNYDATANTDDGSCIAIALGCTDPLAFNYDATANTDDGSCIAIALGCTDPLAFNYDATANTDDGSCIAIALGCTDPLAFNYDATANTDDGSCIAIALGCTDPLAFNYDATANTDDGSCIAIALGCTDPLAFNYDATANTDDGSCIAIALGCTDPLAFNYDATANTDDGSCTYFTFGCTDPTALNYDASAITDDGSCIYCVDGCTDATQFNYDPNATCDDGSCQPFTYGCTDATASNYNSIVNTDDGSCIYFGCTDISSCNYDSTANVDDGTCIYSTTSLSIIQSCDTYTWNGQTYSISGMYTFVTTSFNGCDSIATLNLTINPSSTSTTDVTECDIYTWNGTTYASTGVYTFVTTNANGCDSIATLNLTINGSTISSVSVTECETYTWNGTTYSSSGSYDYITVNAVGCDSIATLNLTINSSTTSTIDVTIPNTYTWNGVPYTSSGVYTYSTLNAFGCDSTATLNLTILTCDAPLNPVTHTILLDRATMTWDAVADADHYEIRFKEIGTSFWQYINEFSTSRTKTNLSSATSYHWQVRTHCDASAFNISEWTDTIVFQTMIPCANTTNLSDSIVGLDFATLTWDNDPNVWAYRIRYRKTGSWTFDTTYTNTITLNGLDNSSVYNWQVKSMCDPNSVNSANWTSNQQFTTLTPLPPCTTPAGFSVTAIGTDNATVNWGATATADHYALRARVAGTSTWTTNAANIYGTSKTMYGLTDGTVYEWQIRSVCSTDTSSVSAWSVLQTFTTSANCNTKPSALTTSNITLSAADLSFTGTANAVAYQVRFKTIAGGNSWVYDTLLAPTVSLSKTSLISATGYKWQVRALCDLAGTNISGWSPPEMFYTLSPCADPTNLGVRNNFTTTTEASLRWYGPNNTDFLLIFKETTASNWDTVIVNNALVTNVTALTSGVAVTSSQVGQEQRVFFTGLSAATEYEWMVITACSPSNLSSAVSGSNFTTLTPLPPCTTPAGFSVTAIGTDNATVNWGATATADHYALRARVAGTSTWTTNAANIYGTSKTMYGLTDGTVYEWQIRSVCSTDTSSVSAWSVLQTFTTSANCNTKPSALTTSNITLSAADLSFTGTANAVAYQVRFKTIAGGNSWVYDTLLAPTVSLSKTSLISATGYKWQVRALCDLAGTNISGWSPPEMFYTLSPCADPTNLGVRNNFTTTTEASLRWYGPNNTDFLLIFKETTASNWDTVIVNNALVTNVTALTSGVAVTSSQVGQEQRVFFTGLSAATEYEWMVITACSPSNLSSAVSGSNFTTLTPLPPCTTPAGFSVTAIGTDNATVNWGATATADHYALRARVAGTSTWTTNAANIYGTSKTMYGLTDGTVYEWQIRSVCSTDTSSVSAWSVLQTFTTSANCNTKPSALTTSNITLSAADLSFTGTANAVAYQVRFKTIAGGNSWVYDTLLAPTVSLSKTSLISATGYKWQVRALCDLAGTNISGWSPPEMFYTLSPCADPTNLGVRNNFTTTTEASLRWYGPNNTDFLLIFKETTASNWDTVIVNNALVTNVTALTSGVAVTSSQVGQEQRVFFTGLSAATEYEWMVITACSPSNLSSAVSGSNFTTLTPLPPCTTPAGFSVTAIGTDNATVNWGATATADHYALRARVAGTSTWTTNAANIYGTSKTMYGLTDGTVYEWQIRSVCSTDTSSVSAWSVLQTFTTSANCNTKPSALTTSNITLSAADLSFTGTANAVAYQVRFKTIAGAWNSWVYDTLLAPTVSLSKTSLISATGYKWQVRALCDLAGTNISGWSPPETFYTLSPCADPTNLGVRNNFTTTTEASLRWYGPNNTDFLLIFKETTASNWDTVIVNNALVTNVTALTSGVAVTSSQVGQEQRVFFTGLSAATEYEWMVITACSPSNLSSAVSGSNFTTLTPLAACTTPAGFSVTAIGTDNATVNWGATATADHYALRARVAGTSTWTTNAANIYGTSKTMYGLTDGTVYEWQIRSVCSTDTSSVSAWSVLQTFTTQEVCAKPTNPDELNITTTTADLVWDAIPAAWGYKLVYIDTSAAWITRTVDTINTNIDAIASLDPGTTYKWRVRALCDSIVQNNSAWRGWQFFTTLSSNRITAGDVDLGENLNVYPNPTNGMININFVSEELDNFEITVIDAFGMLISYEEKQEFVGEYTKSVDLSAYAKGIYMVQIKTRESFITKRIVLQ